MKLQLLYIDFQGNDIMNDMFKNAIIKEEDIENMSEYELVEYKQRLVKEIFTENDFLNCTETREILENGFLWNYQKNMEPLLNNFYLNKRKKMYDNGATIFYYDTHADFFSELNGIVFRNIKKEFDFSVFQNNPSFANPLIAQYEAIYLENNLNTKKLLDGVGDFKQLSQNHSQDKTNKVKSFDWSAKKYK